MSLVKKLDDDLNGLPDQTISIVLVGVAIVAIIVALVGNPTTKAIVAAWLIAP